MTRELTEDVQTWLVDIFKKAKEETGNEEIFVFDFEKKQIVILFNHKLVDEKHAEFKGLRILLNFDNLDFSDYTVLVKTQAVLDRFKNGRYRFISTKMSVINQIKNILENETVGDGIKSVFF